MNADRLLQHFERISEAPDAVPRLRRFILDLVVRGRLVEQDPGDEPAAELLKSIESEQWELAEKTRFKLPKYQHAIDQCEVPFDIPKSWEWARLGQLSTLITSGSRGWAKYYSSTGAIFVRMGNLSRGHYNLRLESIQYVRPPADGEGTRTRLATGDILVSITGDVGLLGLIPPDFGEAYINQHSCMVRLVELQRGRYIAETMRSSFAEQQFKGPQRGIKNSFRLTDIADLLVPLAPLPEQHRIVAKVDELMALCGEFEAAQTTREKRRDRLVAATLHRLNNGDTEPDSGPTFKQTASFYFNHLPRLTTKPEHIQQLRQTILNLAVRGKLVEQDPGDEPAGELLRRAEGEKARLMGAGRRQASQPPEADAQVDVPFPLPDSWRWVRVSEVAVCRLGKMLDKAKNKGAYRQYLRNVNVRWFDFDLSDLLEMRFEKHELAKFTLRAGDVLVCEGGEPGRAAVWDCRAAEVYFQKAIHRVRLLSGIVPTYFVYALYQDATSGRLSQFFTGVTIKHLTGKGLARYSLPLPPLAEQHRIVAKVDELMILCEKLESKIAANSVTSHQLLEESLQTALSKQSGAGRGSVHLKSP